MSASTPTETYSIYESSGSCQFSAVSSHFIYAFTPSTIYLSAKLCNTSSPFNTPSKLHALEEIMRDIPGTDIASLGQLATALAREAIVGKKAAALKP